MVKIGEAYCNEKGKAIGGNAGDQTGRELRISDWRNFGQEYVYRFRDKNKANLAAKRMAMICTSKFVGYDQDGEDRVSLAKELDKVNGIVGKLNTMCETDCSALVSAIVQTVGYNVPDTVYSGNIGSALLKTGAFEIYGTDNYTKSSAKLQVGDILVRVGHHVAMVVEV